MGRERYGVAGVRVELALLIAGLVATGGCERIHDWLGKLKAGGAESPAAGGDPGGAEPPMPSGGSPEPEETGGVEPPIETGGMEPPIETGGAPASLEDGWSMYGRDLENTQFDAENQSLHQGSIAALTPAYRILVGSGATGTPVVRDGVAYFGAWDGYFYAVDSRTGVLKWKVALGRQFIRSTPLVTDDAIYVAVDRSLFALSPSGGGVLFSTQLTEHPQGMIESSPKLADGVIVIGVASFELNLVKDDYAFEGSVVGLDALSGELLWSVPVTGAGAGPCTGGSGVSVWSTAAIDRELGLAYIGTGQTYEAPASTCNDSLLAIHYQRDFVGERVAWKQTFTVDDVYVATEGGLNGLDHDIGAAPNLFRAGQTPAVGVGDKGGTYRVFSRDTGAPLWRVDLETSGLAQLGGVMTTAAVANGRVFVASNQWLAFGFVSTGEHSALDTGILYALATEDGGVLWQATLPAPVFGSFAATPDLLFHATIRGDLYARDVATGAVAWQAELGAPVGSGIGLTDDALFVSGGFSLGPLSSGGVMASYRLGAPETVVFDERSEEFQELSTAQCQERLGSLQPDPACRDCLCSCNPSTTGVCESACWDQASCVVEHCADADFAGAEGLACYLDSCSGKLLPPTVFQQSVNAAACTVTCADACGF